MHKIYTYGINNARTITDTNILLVVFIQCFYLFCDYIWTVSLQ